MNSFLINLRSEINDIFSHNIETSKSYSVPSRNDPGLTFPIGDVKRGKIIETCVLFVDIRNSTALSRNLRANKILLGKIYSAFIHSMTSIADEFGYVRNIIGDRVMVVFEPGNCFEDAVRCAALMYGTAREIIAPYCRPAIFKVGIGIDFGEMLILKTGIRKKHEEQSEYKNLVWVGDAANIASKLTDFAGKQILVDKYNITYQRNYLNDVLGIGIKSKSENDATDPFRKFLDSISPTAQAFSPNLASNSIETITLNDLHRDLLICDGAIFYKSKKVDNLKRSSETKYIAPILISEKVFSNYRRTFPKSLLLRKFKRVECPTQPNTGSGIWGGGFLLEDAINN